MSSPALPATIKLSIFSNACIIVCPSFTVSFFNKTKDSLTACLASVRCSCPPNNACASLLAYAFEESSKSPIFSFAVKIRATASFKRSSLILLKHYINFSNEVYHHLVQQPLTYQPRH